VKKVDKFLGVGLKRATALAIFTMVFILVGKVIFNKYEVTGVSEVFNAV